MRKKIKLLLLVVMMMILAVGCSVQNKFLKSILSIRSGNFVEYKVKVDEVKLKEDIGKIPLNILNEIMTNIDITGDLYRDSKDKSLIKSDFSLNILGGKIPLEIINQGNKLYISADYTLAVTDVLSSTLGMNLTDKDLEDQIKGKYLDISNKTAKKKSGKKKDTKSSKEADKKIRNIFIKNIRKMEKSKFSSEKNIHTAKFENDDLKKLTSEILKVDGVKPEIRKYAKAIDELDNIALVVAIDSKEQKCKVKAEIDKDGQYLKGNIDMNILEKDKTVTLPEKGDILTTKELDDIISKNNVFQEESLSDTFYNISNEDFDSIVAEIKAAKESGLISIEDIDEAIKIYEEIYDFTEEQYKILESLK